MPDTEIRKNQPRAEPQPVVNTVSQDTVRSIPLTMGLCAMVDAADYPQLSKHKWHVSLTGTVWYAFRIEKKRWIFMHTEILGKKEGFVIDHINHYGLDNRRCNLRHCTKSQNGHNRRVNKDGKTSIYRGVHSTGRKWMSQITVKGKRTILGYFDKEIEAARAYDKAAIEKFGEFASINFEYPAGLEKEDKDHAKNC